MTQPLHSKVHVPTFLLVCLVIMGLAGCSAPATAHNPQRTAIAARSAAPAPPGRLLFRRYTDAAQTTSALFISDTDGTHERQIVAAPPGTAQQNQIWSPDGRSIVYENIAMSGDSESHQLMTSAADGSGVHPLTPGRPSHGSTVPGFDGDPAFSPDGRTIAYVHSSGTVKNNELEHSDVYLMRSNGSAVRPITHYAAYSGDSGGIAWSPDGKRLVVGRYDAVGSRTALFVMNTDGANSRQLTPWDVGASGLPDWSANGDLIVFRVAPEETGIGNFFAVHSDGSGLHQITHFANRKIGHKVAFSPDGTWVTFAAADSNGVNDMYIMRTDGTGLRLVKHTPLEENGAAWAPAQS